MESGPTRGAAETPNEWRASPKLAALVRIVAFLTPIGVAALAIRAVSPLLFRPAGILGLLVWIVQAAIVGAIVSRLVGVGTRRLLPLATLLTTTLVFPDRAPSRFGIALRAGTVKQLRARAESLGRNGLGRTEAEAAENAILLVTALARHDRLTRGHTERVRAYADLIAEEMGLTKAERGRLAWGVLLHDVGKMTVPSEVLNKKDKLTDAEWQVLKNHPAVGDAMLTPLAGWLGEWRGAAGEHHERWDGKGYPKGLSGAEISRAGRITAVADAYDVITSKRSYKEPMTAEAARRELVRCAGSQFDPAVVRAMMAVSLGSAAFDAGPLAWISDVSVAQAASAAIPSPAAAGLGVAAVTLATLLGIVDDPHSRRTAIAAGLEQGSAEERMADGSARTTSPLTIATTAPSSVPESVPSPDEAPPPSSAASTSTTSVDPGAAGPDTDSPTTTEPSTTDLPTTDLPTTPAPTTSPATPVTTPAPTTTAPATTPITTTSVPTTPTTNPAGSTTVPTLPPVTVPVVTVPGVTVPSVTVPSVTVPSVTVPSVTVPSVTVPPITTPALTIPSISTPVVTTPAVTVPAIGTPAISTPEVTLPEVTLPTLPTPDLPILGGFFRSD